MCKEAHLVSLGDHELTPVLQKVYVRNRRCQMSGSLVKEMRPRVERAVFRRGGVHFECELLECVLIDALVSETLFNGEVI